MSVARLLLYALLPLFAGCQTLTDTPAGAADEVRLQGQLSVEGDAWFLQPCSEPRRLRVIDDDASGLADEIDAQLGDAAGLLFVDLRGQLLADPQGGDGQLRPSRIYRLQPEGHGCADANFPRLYFRVSGNEPFWSIVVGVQGLVLERPGEPPLALPYLEEQLPEGRFHLSSEANGQRLSLWLTPQRCVDNMSGALRHLRAEVRLDGQLLTGCASYGGARSD